MAQYVSKRVEMELVGGRWTVVQADWIHCCVGDVGSGILTGDNRKVVHYGVLVLLTESIGHPEPLLYHRCSGGDSRTFVGKTILNDSVKRSVQPPSVGLSKGLVFGVNE